MRNGREPTSAWLGTPAGNHAGANGDPTADLSRAAWLTPMLTGVMAEGGLVPGESSRPVAGYQPVVCRV